MRERGLFKAQLEKELSKHNLPLLGVLPTNPMISSVRMDEIQAALNVDMISGRKQQSDLPVNQVGALLHATSLYAQSAARYGTSLPERGVARCTLHAFTVSAAR